MTNEHHLHTVSERYAECLKLHGNTIEHVELYFNVNILVVYNLSIDNTKIKVILKKNVAFFLAIGRIWVWTYKGMV